MRSALTLGRTCFRQSHFPSQCLPIPISSIPRVLLQGQGHCSRGLQSAARRGTGGSQGAGGGRGRGKWQNWSWTFHSPPRRRGLLLAATVGLSPAAFVQLSEKDNSGTEHTTESRMLAASRTELAEKKSVAPDAHGFTKCRDIIIVFLDTYIWEPVCTGLRFLHLVCIFVPVIVTVPVMWVGGRDRERGGERRGCLWWYGFLVRGMERAGPAFIKVCFFFNISEGGGHLAVSNVLEKEGD